ncbi:hypothetical protein FB451DRAFT_1191562 [Mycena latifolia]|nr:hypothetical protein FB451DRAFT_1191562 [Mycena latifolia]
MRNEEVQTYDGTKPGGIQWLCSLSTGARWDIRRDVQASVSGRSRSTAQGRIQGLHSRARLTGGYMGRWPRTVSSTSSEAMPGAGSTAPLAEPSRHARAKSEMTPSAFAEACPRGCTSRSSAGVKARLKRHLCSYFSVVGPLFICVCDEIAMFEVVYAGTGAYRVSGTLQWDSVIQYNFWGCCTKYEAGNLTATALPRARTTRVSEIPGGILRDSMERLRVDRVEPTLKYWTIPLLFPRRIPTPVRDNRRLVTLGRPCSTSTPTKLQLQLERNVVALHRRLTPLSVSATYMSIELDAAALRGLGECRREESGDGAGEVYLPLLASFLPPLPSFSLPTSLARSTEFEASTRGLTRWRAVTCRRWPRTVSSASGASRLHLPRREGTAHDEDAGIAAVRAREPQRLFVTPALYVYSQLLPAAQGAAGTEISKEKGTRQAVEDTMSEDLEPKFVWNSSPGSHGDRTERKDSYHRNRFKPEDACPAVGGNTEKIRKPL